MNALLTILAVALSVVFALAFGLVGGALLLLSTVAFVVMADDIQRDAEVRNYMALETSSEITRKRAAEQFAREMYASGQW